MRSHLIILTVLVIDLMSGCKSASTSSFRGDSDIESPVAVTAEDRAQPTFDWYGGSRGKSLIAARLINICFVLNQMTQELADATTVAIQSINDLGTPWKFAPTGLCGNLRSPSGTEEQFTPTIRVQMAHLGDIAGSSNLVIGSDAAHDNGIEWGEAERMDDQDTRDGRQPAANKATLARFVLKSRLGGNERAVWLAELEFNSAVNWSFKPGTEAFDPVLAALHELGHAMRLDHFDSPLSDHQSVIPTGSITGNNPIINLSADSPLPAILNGEQAQNGLVWDEGNGFADSSVRQSVMVSFGTFGQHGINPSVAVDTNSSVIDPNRYRWDIRDIVKMQATAQP